MNFQYIGLVAEFTALFILTPLLFFFDALPLRPIPVLILVAVFAARILKRDLRFEVFRWRSVPRDVIRAVILRAVISLAVMGGLVFVFRPEWLFNFVRQNFWWWAGLMIIYPLLSAFPQEMLFRAFFLHRYRDLFGEGRGMVLTSSAVFGFVHIIFGNVISVVLSFIGGILFMHTYRRSNSVLLASIEHAVYGNFIFTIGLGQFFYHGLRGFGNP